MRLSFFILVVTSVLLGRPYEQTRSLFDQGKTPSQVGERSLWMGYCTLADKPNVKEEAMFSFRNKRDPIMGDTGNLIFVFKNAFNYHFNNKNPFELPIASLERMANYYFNSESFSCENRALVEDPKAKAWVVDEFFCSWNGGEWHNPKMHRRFWLRENRADDDAIFYTMSAWSADQNRVDRYCYYFMDRSYTPPQ